MSNQFNTIRSYKRLMDIYILIAIALAAILFLVWCVYNLNERVRESAVIEKGAKGAKGDKGDSGKGIDLDAVQVKIVNNKIKTDSRFSIPTRATEGSAGIDLRACIDEPILIKAGESVLVGTGISIYIKDPDYAGIILPRSGLGSKSGIVLGNLVGLIDSDYQGELMVSVWNRSWEDYVLEPATKFAQYVVVPVVTPRFNLVEDFDTRTVRNASGFGSTGL